MSPTAGAFGLAVEPGWERPTTFVVFDPTVESVAEDIRTVKTLLGLDQERNAFRLVLPSRCKGRC
jgi:hypothetical protein